MSIKLIALDLDGTALRPDHLTISPRLQKVLTEAYGRGVQIVPVTGRPYRLLPPFLLDHPAWESWAVLCNGAEHRNLKEGNVTAHFPLPEEEIKKVLSVAEQYSLAVEFNADGRLYLTKESLEKEKSDPKLLFHCSVFLKSHGTIVEDLRELSHLQVEKIHLNSIPKDSWREVHGALSACNVSVVCEKPPNLEVTHTLATKGQGLRSLCRKLDIPMDQVMAIGDSGNDFTMLQEAGIAVAMGNAPQFIKEAADYVTDTNLQDGAAKAISEFVLEV